MAKKKPEEPKKGSPEWMATFSDLMNLLLCFFVLLFSMSTVDAQKFELIASSFSQTFSIFTAGATAIGDGLLVSNGVSQLNQLDDFISSMGKTAEGETDIEKTLNEMKEALEAAQLQASEELAEKVQEAMIEQDIADEVDMEVTSQYVQLSLRGALLFDSGKDTLKEESLPIMEKIGGILERYAERTVEIEGHTDNVPISRGKYRDNNDLSSFRALSVFNYFANNTTLDPAMIKHSGRGEYMPVADNGTPEGRAKNRRVEIRIYNYLSTAN